MAEGTRFAKLEAVMSEIQKNKSTVEAKLGAVEGRMASLEGVLGEYKESLGNLESMMRNYLKTSKEQTPETSTQSVNQVINVESTGILVGKGLKVDVPRFNGEDAEDWAFKIKEFFDVYGVAVEQRIKIALFHMEGPAYAWYKWVIKNELVSTWPEFLRALILRFGTSLYDDPKVALTGTVSKYQAQFEEISTRVTGLSEQWLVSFLISGLVEHLKCEFLLAQPPTCHQVVSLAMLHEKNTITLQSSMKGGNINFSNSVSVPKLSRNSFAFLYPQTKSQTTSTGSYRPATSGNTGSLEASKASKASVASTGNSKPNSDRSPTFKRFTASELRVRREKGLCYYCEEKYHPQHRCKAACFLLVGQDEIEEILHPPGETEERPET